MNYHKFVSNQCELKDGCQNYTKLSLSKRKGQVDVQGVFLLLSALFKFRCFDGAPCFQDSLVEHQCAENLHLPIFLLKDLARVEQNHFHHGTFSRSFGDCLAWPLLDAGGFAFLLWLQGFRAQREPRGLQWLAP